MLSAILALVINKVVVGRLGKIAILTFVPLTEEFLKTGLALYFNSSLFYSHLTFGLVEAVFDVLRPGLNQLPAGILSIISHGLYGYITAKVLTVTGNLWLALGLSIALHGLWNLSVVLFAPQRRES